VINGSKTFISNGTHCDLLVIVAKADPAKGAAGISLIVADTNDRPKGFERVHHASWGRRVADVELLRRHTRGCDHDFVHPILPHWLAECGSLMLGFFLPGMTTLTPPESWCLVRNSLQRLPQDLGMPRRDLAEGN
jgi:hypothetical protein